VTTPFFGNDTGATFLPRLRIGAHFGRRARVLVIAVATFMGVGALFGGYGLLSDAEGLGVKEAWLAGSPFPDYTVPGLFLLVVIGGGLLATAALVAMDDPWSPLVALAMGAILLAWLVVETMIIGYQGGAQVALLVLCGASGLALSLLGWAAIRRPLRSA
jgi:hypothetical protein